LPPLCEVERGLRGEYKKLRKKDVFKDLPKGEGVATFPTWGK